MSFPEPSGSFPAEPTASCLIGVIWSGAVAIPDEVDGSPSRHLSAKMGLLSCNPSKEPPAMEISTIGLDLAKNVFQVHGISATGEVVIR